MIKIYSYSKDKVDMVQEISSMDGDSPQSASIRDRRRIRKRPVRYDQSSDDSSSLSESESLVKKSKQYKIPRLPRATTVPQTNNNAAVEVTKEMEETVSSLSESSYGEEPNKTSESKTAVFNQLIQGMQLMHGELNELNAKSESINLKLKRLIKISGESMIPSHWSLPPGVNIPADTDESLQQLNETLKNDRELSAALVHYLYHSASGKTVSFFVLSITKKILSREVAMMYSRYGRKGKKSFSNLHEILKVILDASALKFKHVSRDDLSNCVGKALAGAPDWNGRKARPSDYQPNSPIFN